MFNLETMCVTAESAQRPEEFPNILPSEEHFPSLWDFHPQKQERVKKDSSVKVLCRFLKHREEENRQKASQRCVSVLVKCFYWLS